MSNLEDCANGNYDNFVGPDDVSAEDLARSLTILNDFAEADLSTIDSLDSLKQTTEGVARSIHNYLLVNASKGFTGYGGVIPAEAESELDLHPKAYTLSLDLFMPHVGTLKTTHVFEGTTDVLHLDYVTVFRRADILNIEIYYNNFRSSQTPTNETMQIETGNKLATIFLPVNGIDQTILADPKSSFSRDAVSIVHTEFGIRKRKDEFLIVSRSLNYRSNSENIDLLRDFAETLQKVAHIIVKGVPLKLEL